VPGVAGAEKLVSPVRGARFVVGVSHRTYLRLVAESLAGLGVRDALVVQAMEGSDEAPLDGGSTMVALRDGVPHEHRFRPEELGLGRATRAQVAWRGEEDEREGLFAALAGGTGPVRDLLVHNAALRRWVADWETPLARHLDLAKSAVGSGAALDLLGRLRGRSPAQTLAGAR
jgi:anthranilate phosphoribosyltransferase